MAVKRVRKVNKVEPAGLSEDTKTILVVVTLLMAYPIGLILMFLWMKWPGWLKILIALPVALLVLAIALMIVVLMMYPRGQIERAKCANRCGNTSGYCYQVCIENGR